MALLKSLLIRDKFLCNERKLTIACVSAQADLCLRRTHRCKNILRSDAIKLEQTNTGSEYYFQASLWGPDLERTTFIDTNHLVYKADKQFICFLYRLPLQFLHTISLDVLLWICHGQSYQKIIEWLKCKFPIWH